MLNQEGEEMEGEDKEPGVLKARPRPPNVLLLDGDKSLYTCDSCQCMNLSAHLKLQAHTL